MKKEFTIEDMIAEVLIIGFVGVALAFLFGYLINSL